MLLQIIARLVVIPREEHIVAYNDTIIIIALQAAGLTIRNSAIYLPVGRSMAGKRMGSVEFMRERNRGGISQARTGAVFDLWTEYEPGCDGVVG